MTARIAPSLTLHLKMLMVIITQDQCDQMLDQKNAQMFSKVAQKISTAVFKSIDLFQNRTKSQSTIFFGDFWELICYQKLSKIAQSGHTAQDALLLAFGRVKPGKEICTCQSCIE